MGGSNIRLDSFAPNPEIATVYASVCAPVITAKPPPDRNIMVLFNHNI